MCRYPNPQIYHLIYLLCLKQLYFNLDIVLRLLLKIYTSTKYLNLALNSTIWLRRNEKSACFWRFLGRCWCGCEYWGIWLVCCICFHGSIIISVNISCWLSLKEIHHINIRSIQRTRGWNVLQTTSMFTIVNGRIHLPISFYSKDPKFIFWRKIVFIRLIDLSV